MMAPAFDRIETPRLVLRRFAAGDAPAVQAYRDDPEVARLQSWDGCSREDAEALVAEMAAHDADIPGTWFQIAIERRADRRVIGDLGLHTLALDPRQVEIGFALARDAQGRGYAAEALAALLAFLFDRLGKHRVVGTTDVRNRRAAALFERLGFRREGHFVQHAWYKGEWCDEYAYAMLAAEWRARRAA